MKIDYKTGDYLLYKFSDSDHYAIVEVLDPSDKASKYVPENQHRIELIAGGYMDEHITIVGDYRYTINDDWIIGHAGSLGDAKIKYPELFI